MGGLCKLWKCWYSYIGLCKDGPGCVGRVVTLAESSPVMSDPSSLCEEGPVCLEACSISTVS